MTKARYLIIGNSAAAVGAVTGIRQQDPDGSIVILSREKEHTYSRPLITYLLGGKVTEDAMYYRPQDFYRQNQVEARLGVEAKALDVAAKKVLTDQDEIGYDKLLLATGGRPILPPDMKGLDCEGVFSFTTWEDARKIAHYIEANQVKRAVVVGGGLIGLKSVEALVARGLKVTVVELADRILSITLDQTASDLAAQSLERAGVELLCGTTVASVQSDQGRISGVTLTSGKKRSCGLLIMAIGVVPAAELARQAGLEVDRGIVVDGRLQTSAEGVFAAGDVAQATEILSGKKMPIPIWPVAYRQGFIAGSNMAGAELVYEGGLAMNSVEICGLPTISTGRTSLEEGDGVEILRHLNREKLHYKKIVLKDNRVVGAVFVGDINRAGIFTGLIKSGIKVAAIKNRLLDEEFGLITLPPSYRDQVQSGKGVVTL